MSPTTDILAKNVKGNPASTEFPYVIAKAPKGDSNPHGFPHQLCQMGYREHQDEGAILSVKSGNVANTHWS